MNDKADPSTTITGETSLMIRRSFDAGIETLFRALTEAEAMKQWFAPGRVTVREAASDLRVGGRWSVGMIAPDGEHHDVSGEFLEVDPPRRVVFTWAWRTTPDRVSRVTYELRPDGRERTTLTLTHDRFADSAARDRHAEGWAGCLAKLGPWLAKEG